MSEQLDMFPEPEPEQLPLFEPKPVSPPARCHECGRGRHEPGPIVAGAQFWRWVPCDECPPLTAHKTAA
jgi:hypothetical protein